MLTPTCIPANISPLSFLLAKRDPSPKSFLVPQGLLLELLLHMQDSLLYHLANKKRVGLRSQVPLGIGLWSTPRSTIFFGVHQLGDKTTSHQLEWKPYEWEPSIMQDFAQQPTHRLSWGATHVSNKCSESPELQSTGILLGGIVVQTPTALAPPGGGMQWVRDVDYAKGKLVGL